jgi:hypothetical protein
MWLAVNGSDFPLVLQVDVAADNPKYDYFRSLVLAIGVCYLARLEDDTRKEYSKLVSGHIASLMDRHINMLCDSDYLLDQIER